ncbi:MAG: hypothetical protein KatS3mg079_248 [Caloramator sp.]|nr:MAG: hypothetical protein KatS3mg079_248 [Caloramator sp.]
MQKKRKGLAIPLLQRTRRSEKEKDAYKQIRDKVTIQSNRRKAREVLYNENAPLLEKVKAAEKFLKRVTKKQGRNLLGKMQAIIKAIQRIHW